MPIFYRVESWHICWIAKIPGKDIAYGDGTFGVPGGLSPDRIGELREKLASDTSEAAGMNVGPSQINITGMTRIKPARRFLSWKWLHNLS